MTARKHKMKQEIVERMIHALTIRESRIAPVKVLVEGLKIMAE
jgi:hypothetical protein